MSRSVALSVLDRVSVASPCTVSWDDMTGDDRARHCGLCKLNVYNLSEMTAQDAAAFVQQREGRTCVRFYRRADGTMITRDCPVGLRALRMKVAKAAGRVAAALAFLLGGGLLLGATRNSTAARVRQMEPFATICRWISPAPPPTAFRVTMGDVCILPPPATAKPAQPAPGGR